MRFTDILHASAEVEKQVQQEPKGTHADEIETSVMVYIAPESVDMSKAQKDFPSGGPFQWRDPKAPNYSPSGIFGGATLTTRVKGERIVRAQIELQQSADDGFHFGHGLWTHSAEPPVWPKTANVCLAKAVALDAAWDSERWTGTGDRYHDQDTKQTFVEMVG